MERVVLPVDIQASSTDCENIAGGAKEATLTQIEGDDTWDKDPENSLNWAPRTKFIKIAMLSSATFFGPVIGAFAETFHPLLRRSLAKSRGELVSPSQPLSVRLREFALVAVFRPGRMLVLEPIVTFICLYAALGFGTLFSFFAAVPYTFTSVYRFDVEQCGLVFLSVVIGCFLGLITIMLCDKLIYQKKVTISFFAWGNISIFITTFQYKTDTYTGNVIASAASANSWARYGFAAAFPLFTVQSKPEPKLDPHFSLRRLTWMQCTKSWGISWASSLLGFFSLVLLPVPWVLFKYGPRIRTKSQYETIQYG
ncbi:unnamed protein product [Clonostachys chloroleuca]|uniref:Uncharacterized protein n=1 Tax=Clonostachys chloroleuca TaxID=1926264 RepID=A0AA35LR40_9HYPO|nr:unnamed protein product [Clonostachys chloroleuca]